MIRRFYAYLARQSWLRKLILSTPVVRDIAWRYVAGEDLDAGLAVVRDLNAKGIAGTLNYVGTHIRREEDAAEAADATIEALRRIAAEGLDTNVSLKLTLIGLDVDLEFCRAQLTRVLDCASDVGIFVRIDMEESLYIDQTIDLFEEALRRFGPDAIGIVIQSYLRQRGDDLERMIRQGARVRLVKGGYWESADVAHHEKADIDRAFLADAERLLTSGKRPALASHDEHFVAEACRLADELGLERGSFEFQMLYGVRPDLQDRLVREGYTVRCYVPYGGQWFAYVTGCVRRAVGDAIGRGRKRSSTTGAAHAPQIGGPR